MRQRGIFVLFGVLFLLSASVLADKISIFDGDLHNGDFVTVAGTEYVFSVNADGKATFISEAGFGLLVYNDTCESKGKIQFCVDNVLFDKHNATIDKDFYYGEVQIYQDTAELEVSREFDATELAIGEIMAVTLTIENNGDTTASSVIYEDKYDNFTIVSANDPCYAKGNSVFFEGSILKETSKMCKYKAKALSPGKYSSKAKFKYNNDVENISSTTDEEIIEVKQSLLDMKIALDKSIVEVGENINVEINMTNDEDDFFSGTMTSSIPTIGFNIISKSYGLYYTGGMPTWKGSVDTDETRQFNLTIEAKRTGDYEISAISSFYYKLKLVNSEISVPIKVKDLNLSIFTNFKDRYLSGEVINAKMLANNPGRIASMFNIKLDSISALPQFVFTKSHDQLMPGQNFELLNLDFTAPKVTEKTNYQIIVDMSYRTDFGQVINRKEILDFIVVPPGYFEKPKEVPPNVSQNNVSELEEVLVAGSDLDEDEVIPSTEIKPNQEAAKVLQAPVIKSFFKNPLLILLDLIIVVLIVYVSYSTFFRKKKPDSENIFVEDNKENSFDAPVQENEK